MGKYILSGSSDDLTELQCAIKTEGPESLKTTRRTKCSCLFKRHIDKLQQKDAFTQDDVATVLDF